MGVADQELTSRTITKTKSADDEIFLKLAHLKNLLALEQTEEEGTIIVNVNCLYNSRGLAG